MSVVHTCGFFRLLFCHLLSVRLHPLILYKSASWYVFCPYSTAQPMLMGLYPFDPISRGRDRSPNKAPKALFSNVALTSGPDGRPKSAVKLRGLPNSYIEIPNNGKLRTTNSISMFVWVKPTGTAGPIINYGKGPAWETHLWQTDPKTLFVRYVKIGGAPTPAVTKAALTRGVWNFVGTTYDGTYATLWVNGKKVASRKINSIRLSTIGPIRIGVKNGDKRYFKGAVACVQLYRVALQKKQIRRAMKRCMRRKYLKNGIGLCVLGISDLVLRNISVREETY